MYDIVFLSYDELNADQNWDRLKSKFPSAKRVHGIKGLPNAYRKCCEVSETEYFFMIDGDQYILDTFDARPHHSELPPKSNLSCYLSRNAINDIEYYTGGIKLLHRTLFIERQPEKVCYFEGILEPRRRVLSENRFNWSPYSTWRGAFREIITLLRMVHNYVMYKEGYFIPIQERLRLVHRWCTVGVDRENGIYSIRGARDGVIYSHLNLDNEEGLMRINDFDWLKSKFNETQI